MREPAPFFALENISKRYGGVHALRDVDFACSRGSIHAVLGENGAGKSTLMKIMTGVVQPDEGRMILEGTPVTFPNPTAANRAGIVCIFQELSLMPELTVADNITLSSPPRRFGFIDGRAQRRRSEEMLARIGCEDINPLSRVSDLPLSRRQMVEIAKALGRDPKLLILDEATSALTAADVDRVYRMLFELKAHDLSILYISHRMQEIEALADRCSVFRNGRHIETFAKGARSNDEIIGLMIGREIEGQFPPKPRRPRPAPLVTIRDLSWENRLNGVGLEAGRGEIVGLGGLDGQGQKELLLALFGVLRGVRGTVTLDGQPMLAASPRAAKNGRAGMALVPEDRKSEGLILSMSIANNIAMASLDRLSHGTFIDKGRTRRAVERAIEQLRIKIGNAGDPVSTLSGGNQQKVVIAKWLATDPDVILLNDPTRGIDVGTKQEIYRLMRDLAEKGACVLFYSTDYEELIGCCDRVAVMYDGRIIRELEGESITERNLIASALNIVERWEPAHV
ncbi:sugar ABC transporter ATP-binding protein [Microvirga soli]|jgi:ribose transport system ATP-binding protein|uniref:sugar ABC transporter ATP-binding protein n=1 Tax=Microvirga soli TaxID=1854496 RepID=UPI00191D4431|nr:sugar ABC transporter ATP-binding protein [Microvirga soli]